MKIIKCKENPIFEPLKGSYFEEKCVLNPGVIYDENTKKFVMVYRAAGNDDKHVIRFGLATSDDGIHFTRYSDKPIFEGDRFNPDGGCVEDPRITKIGNTYFMTYAARVYSPGPYWLPEWPFPPIYIDKDDVYDKEDLPMCGKKNITVTFLAATKDFIHYQKFGRLTEGDIDDRDVVLFPEKINGYYYMISRPKFPNDKMPSIYISKAKDLLGFKNPQLLMTGENSNWEVQRIGISSVPIKTSDGWFALYHAVDKDGVYRVGAILLDLNDPTKVLNRTKNYIMEPDAPYELNGIYNGCVFPTATVLKDGLLYIYYGCADKYIGLATVKFDELIKYIKVENNVKN